MKVAVIGTGAYGLALSLMLAKNNNEIIMWSEKEFLPKELEETHMIKSIFPDKEIPSSIKITNSYEECLKDADLVLISCAAKFVRSVCENFKSYYNSDIPVCIASKGIEEATGSFLSDIVSDILNTNNVSVLSGPTFAIDMANEQPLALALAGTNDLTINTVKKALENDTLKLRECSDLIGIQVCGSIKNVIAIASGMIKGLGYVESTQAFLINESLHDIKYLINSLGGDKKTVLSFAGVGDLLLTCTSEKSRNFSFGYVIGSTNDPEKIADFLKNNTVEGYYTLSSIYKLVKTKNIDLPIINLIYDIVMNGKNPSSLTEFLITKK